MENSLLTRLKKADYKMVAKKQEKLRINPKTIFGLILVFSVLALIADKYVYYASLLTSFICLVTVSAKSAIKFSIALLIMFFLSKGIENISSSIFLGSIHAMLKIGLRLLPVFILAKIISFYSSSYLISVLRSSGIKGNVNIAIALFFRFLPEIKIRLGEIRDGLKIRAFKTNIFHPVKTFELYFVPLLYKCLHISDTLTCSIMTKGIEYEGKKTSFHKISFSLFDHILWIVAVFLMGVTIWKLF